MQLNQEFTYSEAGLALTKSFEGLRLKAYQDSGGIWTVGYGHTGQDVRPGLCVTQNEAETLLLEDLRNAVACVQNAVQIPIEQHQFDALVDFCYNVGRGNFLRSSLLSRLNAGDVEAAGLQFGLWVNVGGRPVAGLARRRAAEAAMFRGLIKAAA